MCKIVSLESLLAIYLHIVIVVVICRMFLVLFNFDFNVDPDICLDISPKVGLFDDFYVYH